VYGKPLCGCTGLASVLAVVTCALAASTVLISATRAVNMNPMMAGPPPRRRPGDTADAMAGWQITLIAVGAAVVAATAAVLLDRAPAVRRGATS
jgi:ABC-type branched-subunit amino acid transport system permease subunit